MRRTSFALVIIVSFAVVASGRTYAQRGRDDANAPLTIVKPARVFDGDATHDGWIVRVKGERIDYAGPDAGPLPPGAKTIDLPGATLTPGLV